MKSEAIQKINTMGKVGSVILLIVKILMIIAMVCTLIGFIVTLLMPANLFSVKIQGNTSIDVKLPAFASQLQESDFIIPGIKTKIEYDGNQMQITDLKQSGSKIHMTASGNLSELNIRKLRGVFLVLLIETTMVLVVMIMGGFLTKAFYTCESPFEENVILKMRNFAIVLIPWALISTFLEGIFNYYLSGNTNIKFNLNMNVIFLALVVFALTYIFKYGAQLQKESDETL